MVTRVDEVHEQGAGVIHVGPTIGTIARVLAEDPGREIVLGGVTQSWRADVVFRGLEPSAFAAFSEPGYVKVAWTLRADPIGELDSVFRTETRVTTTDPVARTKFRWYWAAFHQASCLSAG